MQNPSVRRQRAESKQNIERARILEAATSLFFEMGYFGTTVEAIASALSVTKPFIYRYFDNKEEIFTELCLRSAFAVKTTLVREEENLDSLTALYETCRRLALISIYNYKAGTLPALSLGCLNAEARAIMRREGTSYTTALTDIVSRANRDKVIDCEYPRLTALCIGGIGSSIYRWYSPQSKLIPQELAHEIANTMVRSAGGPSCENRRPKKSGPTKVLSLKQEPWATAYWWLIK